MNHQLKDIKELPAMNVIKETLKEYSFTGDAKAVLSGEKYARGLSDAVAGCVTFCSVKKDDIASAVKALTHCPASLIITDVRLEGKISPANNQLIVFVANPRLSFIQVLNGQVERKPPTFLAPDKIPSTTYVGPHVNIEEGVEIGKDCILTGNIYIHGQTKIGNGVLIKPGAVVGGAGFGYEDYDGKRLHFPHIGGVIIEDNVDIGSCTCIDRGVLGNTILRAGCKIDNLVHIAHNVDIGKDAVVIANAMVAGSVKVGDCAWIAPSAVIRDGITVGENAIVGLGSVALKSVPDNAVVYGVPAKEK